MCSLKQAKDSIQKEENNYKICICIFFFCLATLQWQYTYKEKGYEQSRKKGFKKTSLESGEKLRMDTGP